MSKTLSSNMEDYLEAISLAANEEGLARVTDVRDLLGVKTPSVTGRCAYWPRRASSSTSLTKALR